MITPEEMSQVQSEKILIQAPPGIPPAMVRRYVNRSLTALPAAKTALDRSDYRHLQVLGHRLKGSGGAYGIPALTAIGSEIEAAALGGDTAELQRQVAALEACLNRLEIPSE